MLKDLYNINIYMGGGGIYRFNKIVNLNPLVFTWRCDTFLKEVFQYLSGGRVLMF